MNRLQTLEVSRRDQVWVGDITYVRLKGHFVYVSLLMDVFTRMIRGWQMSQHLTQPLTLNLLQHALRRSVPEIHHSDQGVEYLSGVYLSTLTRHGVEISVARRGFPWENGYAERLIRTLKEEEVHLNDYENITEARKRIGHFITQVYHQKRPHSALGYLTPIEFQKKLVLTLLIFGLNKRMHYILFAERNFHHVVVRLMSCQVQSARRKISIPAAWIPDQTQNS